MKYNVYANPLRYPRFQRSVSAVSLVSGSHMDRHNRYYRESRSEQTHHIQPPHSPFPVVDNPSRIRAWVSGGNTLFTPGGMLPARVLSIEESVKLMQKAQKQYQVIRSYL